MWKVFNKEKPKKDGWYTTTIEIKGQQRYVMDLYWYSKKEKFIDNIRKDVYQTYTVLNYKGDKVSNIDLDRTDEVIAWQELPEVYMDGFVKENIYDKI